MSSGSNTPNPPYTAVMVGELTSRARMAIDTTRALKQSSMDVLSQVRGETASARIRLDEVFQQYELFAAQAVRHKLAQVDRCSLNTLDVGGLGKPETPVSPDKGFDPIFSSGASLRARSSAAVLKARELSVLFEESNRKHERTCTHSSG